MGIVFASSLRISFIENYKTGSRSVWNNSWGYNIFKLCVAIKFAELCNSSIFEEPDKETDEQSLQIGTLIISAIPHIHWSH